LSLEVDVWDDAGKLNRIFSASSVCVSSDTVKQDQPMRKGGAVGGIKCAVHRRDGGDHGSNLTILISSLPVAAANCAVDVVSILSCPDLRV